MEAKSRRRGLSRRLPRRPRRPGDCPSPVARHVSPWPWPCLCFLPFSCLDSLRLDSFHFKHLLHQRSLKPVLTARFQENVLRALRRDSGDSAAAALRPGPGPRAGVPGGGGAGLAVALGPESAVCEVAMGWAPGRCLGQRRAGGSLGRGWAVAAVVAARVSGLCWRSRGGLLFVLGVVPDPSHTQGAELLGVGDDRGPGSVSSPRAPPGGPGAASVSPAPPPYCCLCVPHPPTAVPQRRGNSSPGPLSSCVSLALLSLPRGHRVWTWSQSHLGV